MIRHAEVSTRLDHEFQRDGSTEKQCEESAPVGLLNPALPDFSQRPSAPQLLDELVSVVMLTKRLVNRTTM